MLSFFPGDILLQLEPSAGSITVSLGEVLRIDLYVATTIVDPQIAPVTLLVLGVGEFTEDTLNPQHDIFVVVVQSDTPGTYNFSASRGE